VVKSRISFTIPKLRLSRETLWASLKDDNQTFNGRQEGRQRTTLIVIKNYFVMLLNKVETDPTLKNGAYSEKPNE
jgi:hypothetical protein